MPDDFDWKKKVDIKLSQIDDRINAMEVRGAVDEVHHSTVERRLSAIESTLIWLTRLIIGALILTAVGFGLSGGFAP